MNKKYDLIVYIGRFQPFHNAHQNIVNQAFQQTDNVLVLVGSKESPRTIKNPWTYNERKDFINSSCQPLKTDVQYLEVQGIHDHIYDDNAWVTEVGEVVRKHSQGIGLRDLKIAVIGHDKDRSSFYLNYFPQWEFIAVPSYPSEGASIDATKIRELMFKSDFTFIKGVVPNIIFATLNNTFFNSKAFLGLQQEWDYIKGYTDSWLSAPYAPTFVTVDAVVVQSGHILLIQRGEYPGKGLWAMPGGYIDPGERIRKAVVRELYEETKLKVPAKVLDRAIDAVEIFDHPDRSLRGRTITHTHRITLDPTQSLPKVKGSDDAAKAKWFTLAEYNTMENKMFEDHYYIIQAMLACPSL